MILRVETERAVSAPDQRFLVSALRNLYRKPSKLTLAAAAATSIASVAVASGVALAAPDATAGQAMSVLPAARSVTSQPAGQAGLANPVRQLEGDKALLAALATRRLAIAERRAVARRAAARRAAQQRAAARRAAQQQAQQAQQAQQDQQATGSPANASSATPTGAPQPIALALLGSLGVADT